MARGHLADQYGLVNQQLDSSCIFGNFAVNILGSNEVPTQISVRNDIANIRLR